MQKKCKLFFRLVQLKQHMHPGAKKQPTGYFNWRVVSATLYPILLDSKVWGQYVFYLDKFLILAKDTFI